MAYQGAPYGAHSDNTNQVFSTLGVIGTLGTADTQGTSPTLPIGIDPSTGAAYVYNLGPAGSTSVAPNLPVIAGTPSDAGTVIAVRLSDGTSFYTAGAGTSGGTVVSVANGSIAVIAGTGIVTNGSIRVTTGTINTGTIDAATVTGGSIVVTTGTIGNGSIRVTVGTINTGTVGGAAATAAAMSGNPIVVGGVDTGGTVYGLLTDIKGQQILGGGTVDTVSALTSGSVRITVGTITVLPNLPQGSIQVTAGTGIVTSGSIAVIAGTEVVTGGSIRVTVGTINTGTVGGAGATAAALSGNPIPIAGVDSGGTAYGVLVDAKGQPLLGGGTVDTVSSLTNGSVRITIGTITVLPNLPQGSIQVTAGTGIVTSGSIAVIAGTGVVTGGSIVVTNGTVGAGSIVVTAGTVTHGTIDIGTVKPDGRAARNILSYGTTFGATAAAYGTLVGSASVGAGTATWINDLSIINSGGGTLLAMIGFGTALNGTSVLAKGSMAAQGGIQKSYPLAVNAGMTNQDLVCYVGAAGTIDVAVSYFISV